MAQARTAAVFAISGGRPGVDQQRRNGKICCK